MRVNIIGGGIGGLTAALFLIRSGHTVRVFDQAPELSEAGAGLTLWPNAVRVLEALGLGEALSTAGHVDDGAVIGTSSGRVLRSASATNDRSLLPLGIHRARLQTILAERLPTDTLELGRTAIGFQRHGDDVIAHFADHPDEASDILIGADGVRSTIRTQVIGDGPPRYAGYTAFRGVAPAGTGPTQPSGEFWGRGRRFGVVPIGQGQLYWFATLNQPEGRPLPVEARTSRLLDAFAGWAFDIPGIIARTPSGAVLHHDVVDRPPRRGWSLGRVALIGDAAHPMTPNLGQGAAMAIEDAPVLARSLQLTAAPCEAFAVFERTRAPRTARLNRLARRLGDTGQTERRWRQIVRDQLTAALPTGVQNRLVRTITSYDAVTAPLASSSRSAATASPSG